MAKVATGVALNMADAGLKQTTEGLDTVRRVCLGGIEQAENILQDEECTRQPKSPSDQPRSRPNQPFSSVGERPADTENGSQ